MTDAADDNGFGSRLRRLRTARGYTAAQFAAECGIHRSRLSRIETGAGMITPALVGRFAKTLDVTTDALFTNLVNPEGVAEAPPVAADVLETRWSDIGGIMLVELTRGRAHRWEVYTYDRFGNAGVWERFATLPEARLFVERLTNGEA